MMRTDHGSRRGGRALAALCCAGMTLACGGGSQPAPAPGFAMLTGKNVLVLPVQFVARAETGWIGGAPGGREAARLADREIAFALEEEGGRATWILPEDQLDLLRRRPSIRVSPYALSTGELRDGGGKPPWGIQDPLYGEIRALAALFDSRLVVWPLEVLYLEDESGAGQVGIRTLLIDARAGEVLWDGVVRGAAGDVTGPGALASAAQAFAARVSP